MLDVEIAISLKSFMNLFKSANYDEKVAKNR